MRTLLSALFLCVLSQVVGAQTADLRYTHNLVVTLDDSLWREQIRSVGGGTFFVISFYMPLVSRHVELPSIDPLPCQSKAVGLGIGFRPCEDRKPVQPTASAAR